MKEALMPPAYGANLVANRDLGYSWWHIFKRAQYMQHTTPISKRWDYSYISGDCHTKIKGLAHMVEATVATAIEKPQLPPIYMEVFLSHWRWGQ